MANKNEAKIKFTAETGEFNAAIKQSESTMKVLRAELKLNETQMKATGATVEGLEEKHQILQKQLKASEDKTEALSNKLEAAVRIYGENSAEVDKWRTQLLNAQSAQERLRQDVSRCENELNDLKNATDDAGGAMNKAADDAKRLDQSVEDAGDSARGAGDGFTVMKGIVANLASEAIQFAIDKVSDFISYLGELPEATREFRQDMATLVTSFDTAGFSADTAKETWKDLYRIFGEDDRAVEAANLIAKMADDQKDLSNWTKIAMGIWGEYQDSLAVEALAEAANETVKTGTVTGNLADALNWSTEAAKMFAKYMSEDVVTAEDAFNVALSECTSEQERHALITKTLLTLYEDSAEKYAEVSGAQLEAKEAAAELALAEAGLAAAVEPVTTAWDGLKATLITGVTPAAEAAGGALAGIINGAANLPSAFGEAWAGISAGAETTISILGAIGDATVDWIGGGISSMVAFASSGIETLKMNAATNMENIKSSVDSAISSIKGFLDFDWSLPDIPTPHFSIVGEFSWNPPSVPSLSVDWYAKGAIFTKPTMFATPFGYKGVGEAGAEAVLPIEKLEGYIMGAIEKTQQQADLRILAAAIEDLATRPIWMDINGKRFATATAGDGDSVNGLRSVFKDRGLAI